MGLVVTEKERIEKALALVLKNNPFADASYHKQWIIAEICRVLSGNKYKNFIQTYETKDKDGCYDMWDLGEKP